MLNARAYVVAGFVVITLVFGLAIANKAVAMADTMKNHVQATTHP